MDTYRNHHLQIIHDTYQEMYVLNIKYLYLLNTVVKLQLMHVKLLNYINIKYFYS